MTVVPRSGGEATRAGIAYEDAIILSYLVEILDGTALSFALEGSTTVEGFEGALVRSSGTEQLQCKRSAHNSGTWTVKRLHSEGVLANIVAAAQQGNSVRFVTDQRSVVEARVSFTGDGDELADRKVLDTAVGAPHVPAECGHPQGFRTVGGDNQRGAWPLHAAGCGASILICCEPAGDRFQIVP